MTDKDFCDGIYADPDMTLEEFIVTYVGGPLCWSTKGKTCANGETWQSCQHYLEQTVARLNRYLNLGTTPTPTPSPPSGNTPIALGRVPRPTNYSERIIAPGVNTAWNDLGPRIPRGMCIHRMLGTLVGTDAYFRGAASGRALTDFGVGNGGAVYRWTKPGAQVAPWASGPADGVKEDGVAFVNRYGVNAINRDLFSIEIEGYQTDPMPPADWRALVELVAWIADTVLKIDYQKWPMTRDGLTALYWHREFTGQKECPFQWVIQNTPRLIEDVRARMKSYQVAA